MEEPGVVRSPIAFALAFVLFSSIPTTTESVAAPCPTDPSPWIQVQGVVYIRQPDGDLDPLPYVYLESNGIGGLQYGGQSPVGTFEPGGPCNGGDMLLY